MRAAYLRHSPNLPTQKANRAATGRPIPRFLSILKCQLFAATRLNRLAKPSSPAFTTIPTNMQD
jgi:hypothetical protein